MPQPYSNVWPCCLGKKPVFFFPGLKIVQDISFGAKAHTCTLYNYVAANAMESSAKLNKLEQTHKSDKCTYICHQKLHCTVLIIKNYLKKEEELVKGSLFHYLHRLYTWNSYSLQNESLHLMLRFIICSILIHHVWFTANCLRVLRIIYYAKINHQLFRAHSLKKGRRGACMETIFLATELMHFLWTNQPSKFSNLHNSLSIFHLNLISCLYNRQFFF